jgi:DNA helicase IV
VLALSNRLLRQIAPSLAAPVAVRDAPDALTSVQVTPEEVADEVAGHAAAARERPGSIGVIVARDRLDAVATSLAARGVRWSGVDEMARGERVTLLVGEEAKGLEFDVVVLAEPARIMAMHPKGLRLVYIAMTRAVSRLVMVQTSQLLEILAS